jgi:hypothetical protein
MSSQRRGGPPDLAFGCEKRPHRAGDGKQLGRLTRVGPTTLRLMPAVDIIRRQTDICLLVALAALGVLSSKAAFRALR